MISKVFRYIVLHNALQTDKAIFDKNPIVLARAPTVRPKILILDEATSPIDTQTEKLLQKGIQQVLSGRTSFIVAHRLSTIRNCDRILYIADRGIAEAGTHDELMAQKGLSL
ncbi:MAG: hypothetical protein U0L09_00485 [Christensenellales bacterium]|nr:hypothetical protein [Christensenellales bacterium]